MVEIIIYSDFANPKEVYDSLAEGISDLELTDSIRIIGRPIFITGIEIKIDTLRATSLGFVIEKVQEEIIKMDKSGDINELMDTRIKNESGIEIAISNLATFHCFADYYKPRLFLPDPEEFYYKEKKAIKVECFCKRGKKKQLIKYIESNIDRFSDYTFILTRGICNSFL